MSTHPYIPLYVDDYDAHTSHLTPAQDGIYGRMLRLAWRTPGCSLPNDEAWIARKVRLTSSEWARIGKPVLDEFFRLQRGRFVQKRLKAEYDDISRKKTARKTAGKLGGEAKARKTKENASSNATLLLTDARAFPEPYPEPEKEERSNDLFVASGEPTATVAPKREAWDGDPIFGKLWDAAPPMMRKRAKSKAKVWPEWQRAIRRGEPAAIYAGFVRYKALDADLPRSGGPGLHIWLRDRTWEQWPSADTVSTETIGADWPDTRWSAAVALWRQDGSWDDRLGPKPDQPGCRAPAAIIPPNLNSKAAA